MLQADNQQKLRLVEFVNHEVMVLITATKTHSTQRTNGVYRTDQTQMKAQKTFDEEQRKEETEGRWIMHGNGKAQE